MSGARPQADQAGRASRGAAKASPPSGDHPSRTAFITFALYSIAFECLVWGGGMYIIITQGWSPWWVAFLFLISGSQIPPGKWREITASGMEAPPDGETPKSDSTEGDSPTAESGDAQTMMPTEAATRLKVCAERVGLG